MLFRSLGFLLLPSTGFYFISPLSNPHNFSRLINAFWFLQNFASSVFHCIYTVILFSNQSIYERNFSLQTKLIVIKEFFPGLLSLNIASTTLWWSWKFFELFVSLPNLNSYSMIDLKHSTPHSLGLSHKHLDCYISSRDTLFDHHIINLYLKVP